MGVRIVADVVASVRSGGSWKSGVVARLRSGVSYGFWCGG
jgi:hypothetical protein